MAAKPSPSYLWIRRERISVTWKLYEPAFCKWIWQGRQKKLILHLITSIETEACQICQRYPLLSSSDTNFLFSSLRFIPSPPQWAKNVFPALKTEVRGPENKYTRLAYTDTKRRLYYVSAVWCTRGYETRKIIQQGGTRKEKLSTGQWGWQEHGIKNISRLVDPSTSSDAATSEKRRLSPYWQQRHEIEYHGDSRKIFNQWLLAGHRELLQ